MAITNTVAEDNDGERASCKALSVLAPVAIQAQAPGCRAHVAKGSAPSQIKGAQGHAPRPGAAGRGTHASQ